jgi:hypothetical protein
MEVCKGVFPEMIEVAKNHQVACYWVAAKLT